MFDPQSVAFEIKTPWHTATFGDHKFRSAIITIWQVFLGIATLLMQAPELLAAAHQVTAALLLCAAVWHAYEIRIWAPDTGRFP